MINLYFHGRIKNRKAYEVFCEDVIAELFPREFTKREIDIHIKFSIACAEGAFGYAQPGDCEDEFMVEVGKIVIDGEFRQQTPREIAATLAHELTHVRQYVRKELNGEMTKWKGQTIPYGPRGGLKIKYRQQPWEQEAFQMEEYLTEALWAH
jgi:hypothetical protein